MVASFSIMKIMKTIRIDEQKYCFINSKEQTKKKTAHYLQGGPTQGYTSLLCSFSVNLFSFYYCAFHSSPTEATVAWIRYYVLYMLATTYPNPQVLHAPDMR